MERNENIIKIPTTTLKSFFAGCCCEKINLKGEQGTRQTDCKAFLVEVEAKAVQEL